MMTEPSRRSTHAPRRRRSRRPVVIAVIGAVAVVGLAAAALAVTSRGAHPSAGPSAGPSGSAAAPATQPKVPLVPVSHQAPVTMAQPGTQQAAKPTGLDIPSIGVRSQMIDLGLASNGELEVPTSTTVTSWYTGSPRPGDVGTSVILGHIDSYKGPGVFFKLRDLKAGSLVYVDRADGSRAEFRVYAVHTYPKDAFPTATVYGPAPDAELRLITCGGAFDSATGHYVNNIVAFAAQVDPAAG